MPQHEQGLGETVEDAAEDHAQRMGACLHAPAPGGPGQFLVGAEAGVGLHGVGGMQIDGRLQFLGLGPEGVELALVQIGAHGIAVDHGALEAEVAHAALEFTRRSVGILQGDMGETQIAVGAGASHIGEKIIGLGGLRRGASGVGLHLHAGASDGENRLLDARAIHAGEAHVAEIREGGVDLVENGLGHIRHGRLPVFDQPRRDEVFFQRDLLHGVLPWSMSAPGASGLL